MPHNHTCYFHQPNRITHFCTRVECTLPMCQKCLPIHLLEHPPTDLKEYIITFNEAEQTAVNGLKNMLVINNSIKAQYTVKMQQIRSRINHIVDGVFTEVRNVLDAELTDVGQIQKKLNKIQKGSLKTLIYYFTEQHKSINKNILDQKLAFLEKIQKSFSALIETERNFQLQRNKGFVIASFNDQQNNHHFQSKAQSHNLVIERASQNGRSSHNLHQIHQNNQIQQIQTQTNTQNHAQSYSQQVRQSDRHYGQNLQAIHQQSQQMLVGRERGYSFDINQNLTAKTQNVRSSSQLKTEHTTIQLGRNIQGTSSSKNHIAHDSNKKLKTDSSYRVLNRCLTPKEDMIINTVSNTMPVHNKVIKSFENNFNVQEFTQEERQRQIENIRIREEQKQIEKQRQKDRENQRQRERQRERQRQREKERQRERERERERQRESLRQRERQKQREAQLERRRTQSAKQTQILKLRQQNRQNQIYRTTQRTTQDLGLQSTKQRYPSTPYQLLQIERTQGRGFENSTRKQTTMSHTQTRTYNETKKPLQISDLNIQTKYTGYQKFPQLPAQLKTNLNMNMPSSQNNLQMSKQVLSPDEIRKMLQKRIQERSKLISKNKSVSQIRNTQYSVSKSFNKSKQLTSANVNGQTHAIGNTYGSGNGYLVQGQSNYIGEGEGRWDTKDSIINQIYEDYR